MDQSAAIIAHANNTLVRLKAGFGRGMHEVECSRCHDRFYAAESPVGTAFCRRCAKHLKVASSELKSELGKIRPGREDRWKEVLSMTLAAREAAEAKEPESGPMCLSKGCEDLSPVGKLKCLKHALPPLPLTCPKCGKLATKYGRSKGPILINGEHCSSCQNLISAAKRQKKAGVPRTKLASLQGAVPGSEGLPVVSVKPVIPTLTITSLLIKALQLAVAGLEETHSVEPQAYKTYVHQAAILAGALVEIGNE